MKKISYHLVMTGECRQINCCGILENVSPFRMCSSLCIWSAMKKKPLCVKQFAHGKAENGDANWISAIATMINADVIASGKTAKHSAIQRLISFLYK